jgi:hypothetical protein
MNCVVRPLFFLVFVLLGSALAPEPAWALRAPDCGDFERAKKASYSDAYIEDALKVWNRVQRPVNGLTGRRTSIQILSPSAQSVEGYQFPALAMICEGAPPTVYVTYAMLELVYKEKAYPKDFLAFVLGHELGHRVNDFTGAGMIAPASQRPGKGHDDEAMADMRAAFYTAVAGFSSWKVAQGKLVDTFLAIEAGMRGPAVKRRRKFLLNALKSFDGYENLYQSAVALTFGGELGAAQRLLAWADELVAKHKVPLAELKVLRALVLIMEAAPDAPWLVEGGLPLDLSSLRCMPLFPGHTGLVEKAKKGPVRSADELKSERAGRLLRRARRLLDQSTDLGADPFIVASAQACAAFYLGYPKEARRWERKARKAMPKRAPKAVRTALNSNCALIHFIRFLDANPLPESSDVDNARGWSGALRQAASKMGANRELMGYVDALVHYPDQLVEPTLPPKGPVCKNRGGPPAFRQSPPPAFPSSFGKCPSGWKLAHTLPEKKAARRSGSSMGVTTCIRPGKRTGERLVRIRLAGAMQPRLDAVDMTILLDPSPSGEAKKLQSWACGCSLFRPSGVSDLGDEAYLGACPKLGIFKGVIFTDSKGRVRRFASFRSN